MELLQELTLLIEEAKPMRAWNGQLKKIDDLMSWMYTKNILSASDKKKKDVVFRQYYRYYNDGDMPQALKSKGFNKYSGNNAIQTALEEYLENFVKEMLAKYMPKVDRTEFRIDKWIERLTTLRSISKNNDAHGLLTYWLKDVKLKDPDNVAKEIVDKLEKSFNKLRDDVNKAHPDSKNKVMSFRRELLQKDGVWTDKFEADWNTVTEICDELTVFIDDLISSLKKMKKVKEAK